MELLNSNIKSIIIKNENIDSCTILFLFNVGSINENKDINGISHFIEHMVFKGNKEIRNNNDLLKKLDNLGADYNAFTTNNLTGYHIKVMKKYQTEAFQILYNMLFESVFDINDINTEREVIKEEYLKDKNDSGAIIEDLTIQNVLKGTPYQLPIVGTIDSINNIKKQNIINYWEKYYKTNNCVIVINGNIQQSLINNIKKIKVDKKSILNKEPIIFPNTKKSRVLIEKNDSEQTMLSIAFKSFGLSSNHRYTLDVISNILGGNMSSRLFLSLREKNGLVYEIDCGNTFFKEEGYIQISCSFENSNLIKIIDIIFEEIKLLKHNYINDNELKSNIKYLSSMELLSKEDTVSFSEEVATEYILTDKLITPDKNIIKYQKVNKNKIKQITNHVFQKDNINIIILGNYEPKKIKHILNHKIDKI